MSSGMVPGRLADPDLLDGTAAACAFLSQLLLLPDAAPTVSSSMDPGLAAQWPLPVDEAGERGVALLQRALAHPASGDELEADFRALFVGPGPLAAPPWESVHRDDEGLTFQEDTLDVRERYARVGLQAPAPHREPDDHIGLELAFVGELAVAALRAHDAGDVVAQGFAQSELRSFVAEHLVRWAPAYGQLIAERAATDLYRAVGELVTSSSRAIASV